MRKRIRKVILTGVIIATTIGNSTIPSLAASLPAKEENVYAALEGDGSVKGIYVVNSYDLSESMEILDYGSYQSIKNLTSDEKIMTENGVQTVQAKQGNFYYQGNLESKEMPWNISIRYFLEEKEVEASDLGGKTGNLVIKISVKQNPLVSKEFFENYLLQVSLSLDTNQCKSIVANGATIGNVGDSKQILYTILPGNEKEMEVSVDVSEFEMDPISFQGVESNLELNAGSIDQSSITEETEKITEAAKTLDDAAFRVNDGVTQLKEGATELREALQKLEEASHSLRSGSTQVKNALIGMQEELDKVTLQTEGLKKLVKASKEVKEGMNGLEGGVAALDQALEYGAANQNIWYTIAKQTNQQVTKEKKGQLELILCSNDLSKMLALMPESELKGAMLSYIQAAQNYVTIQGAYEEGIKAYFSAIKGSVDTKSGSAYLSYSASLLCKHYEEFDQQIVGLEQTLGGLSQKMTELKEGVDTLVREYTVLDTGITSYASGVGAVLTGFGKFESGIKELQDGTTQLKEETEKFVEETKDIDSVVEEKIDVMIDSFTGSDFEKKSFVSEKNTNINSVQFVMATDSIEKPEVIINEVEPKEKNFFEKLLDLFR